MRDDEARRAALEASPPISCPAIWVPEIEPCPSTELEPLIEWLSSAAPIRQPTTFVRGTALPDGRLDLCKQSLGVEGAVRVLRAFDGSTFVRSLLLGTDGLGDVGAAAVATLIRERRAPALRTLYLGCNRIELAGVEALAEALADPSSPVRALWLKRNLVGPRGAAVLAKMLRAQPALELLDLTNSGLGDAGVEPIVAALRDQVTQPRGLARLLIGGNGIGPCGAMRLGELLAVTPHLRELGLAVSRLGDAGARALANGLARNHSLERIDLASCAIGPEGLAAIVDALRTHPRSTELSLGTTPSTTALGERDNDLRDRIGAELLAGWLAEDPPLRRLDLVGSGIRSAGALCLLDALATNTNLVDLQLGKHVARRIKRRLRARLEHNAAVRPFDASPPPHVAAILSVYRSKTIG
jgi:Ran GTPase-activating protein (RanGAP) involved in mRNA processing and transport